MVRKKEKIKLIYIIISFLILIVGALLFYHSRGKEDNSYRDLQIKAAKNMLEAEEYMKAEILSKGIEIEAEDLNRTGLLGPEFTYLTTTPGNVDAKRTSLSPDFAALLVRYFIQAGLEEGDVIAIGSSGSFPGLLIAALAAGDAMNLEMRVIASLGSSMHGATRPEYNIFDILNAMKEGGFASFSLLAVSLGGYDDHGGGLLDGLLYDDTTELWREIAKESGAYVIEHESLEESIQERLELYGDDIDLFVSIGGASPNCGSSSYTLNFPQGLVLDPPTIPSVKERGLNYEYAARGIPVINLLNVRGLASENGITVDPVPFDEIGKSGVYSLIEYSGWILISTLVFSIFVLALGLIKGKRDEKEK